MAPRATRATNSHRTINRGSFAEHRGTGFAGPPVLPPARGLAKRHEVREAWGSYPWACQSTAKKWQVLPASTKRCHTEWAKRTLLSNRNTTAPAV